MFFLKAMAVSCEFVRRGFCIPFLLVYGLFWNTLTLNCLVLSFLLADQHGRSLDASAGCILWHVSCPKLNFSSRHLFCVSLNQVTVWQLQGLFCSENIIATSTSLPKLPWVMTWLLVSSRRKNVDTTSILDILRVRLLVFLRKKWK